MNTKEMIFEWGWCELCNTAFIYCPKCNNNCCNGGSGEVDGKPCDICNLAYQYQSLAWDNELGPKKGDKCIVDKSSPMRPGEKEILQTIFGDKIDEALNNSGRGD